MADVFLSYSRLDRPAAEAMAQALEGQGWSVWWDRKIVAGDSFDRTIERELESATCVIVLWSKASIDSDWVKNEAAAAVERNALIPVMIDSVRLPIEFRRKQTIDLSEWNRTSTDPALTLVLSAVSQKLKGLPIPTSAPAIPARPRFRFSRTTWSLLAIGCAGLALAGMSVLHTDSTNYTLVCMGGGPFGIQTDGYFAARVAFIKAPGPATEPLHPGQCAWTDRAVNGNEPTEMCYSGLSASTLSKRFSANELVRQQVHYEAANDCLRIASLL